MAYRDEYKKSELSEALRQLRISHGYTQTRVAEFLNMNRSTYTRYENGREPDLYSLKALATLYEVSLDEIISGKYSEETGRYAVAKSASIEVDDSEYHFLSNDEKKLIAYFRAYSQPADILQFAEKLYRTELYDNIEYSEKNS